MQRFFSSKAIQLALILFLAQPALPADAVPGEEISVLERDAMNAGSALQAALPRNALWSLSVSSLRTEGHFDTGNSVDVRLTAASLVKLFVTAALLESDAEVPVRMSTLIMTDGEIINGVIHGSLYIKGQGDALLSERDLAGAVSSLFEDGIREITGDIVADDSYLDAGVFSPPWEGPAYAAPGALGIDLHTVSVGRNSADGTPVISPINNGVQFAAARRGDDISQLDDLHYLIPEKTVRERFSLRDPALFAAQTLRTLLEAQGIVTRGRTMRAITPETAAELSRIEAKPLLEMIADTNMNSLNVMAENMFLVLGARKYGAPGTYQKGKMAVEDFLSRIGMPSGSIRIADGSGLSEENRIRSSDMVAFLRFVASQPWFGDFYGSLPRAGIDGTLKGLAYQNKDIRAKTGQTNDVYSLAGFYSDSSGEPAVFSLMVNVPGADMLNGIGEMVLSSLSGQGLLQTVSVDR